MSTARSVLSQAPFHRAVLRWSEIVRHLPGGFKPSCTGPLSRGLDQRAIRALEPIFGPESPPAITLARGAATLELDQARLAARGKRDFEKFFGLRQ